MRVSRRNSEMTATEIRSGSRRDKEFMEEFSLQASGLPEMEQNAEQGALTCPNWEP